jgi:cysteinyl-tRNA synthetase
MPRAAGAPLRLFNTLGGRFREFVPLEPGAARMYSCGPTVYAYQHVGNLRAYVFADTLRRALEWKGHEVVQVISITDVGHLTSDMDEGDDKLELASEREHRSVWDIAAYYTEIFVWKVQPLSRWQAPAQPAIKQGEIISRRLPAMPVRPGRSAANAAVPGLPPGGGCGW